MWDFSHCFKKRLLNASWHLEKIKAGNRHRFVIRWRKYASANSNFWGINNNQNSCVLNVDKPMEASSSASMCGWNLFKDRFSDNTQSSAGPPSHPQQLPEHHLSNGSTPPQIFRCDCMSPHWPCSQTHVATVRFWCRRRTSVLLLPYTQLCFISSEITRICTLLL